MATLAVSPAAALRDVRPRPFWLDHPDAPEPLPPLPAPTRCDLAVVGGGFTGLWTALLAAQRDPGRDVLLLEADRVGGAASGRNGGFCAASLTHGAGNAEQRFGEEAATLERLGRENLDAIEATVRAEGIDCDFRRTGELLVATQGHQVAGLVQEAATARRLGGDPQLLSREQVRAQIDSPRFLAGLWDRDGCATVDPARLAWGLRRAVLAAGVRVVEGTPVTAVDGAGAAVTLRTPAGAVRSGAVAMATGAAAMLPPVRRRVVPVYDYALVTEPLDAATLGRLGWSARQGLADSGNRFHYSRLTADDRILWGGYDAVYHYGSRTDPRLERLSPTHSTLAGTFARTFPQLDGIRFSHAWGGVIDTCSRFCAFFGTTHRGRVGYAAGYTGLGVGASRFGARVLLDLLAGRPTELTRLRMVRERPLPFPPEPLRWAGIQLTRWSLARADTRAGRRNGWLRTLDRVGMGFDS